MRLDIITFLSARYKMLFTVHERVCTKDYKLPDSEVVVQKGRIVHVYFDHFVNDPKNYINPEKFDPENFNPENKPNKFAFMMFGQGPRACPGKVNDCINHIYVLNSPGTRYAFLTMKIFLVKLLQSYKVIPSEKTNMGIAEVKWKSVDNGWNFF